MEHHTIPIDISQNELFFHVCTDGARNGIIHTCTKDYYQATTLTAITAIRKNIDILCYCHMSTHSHFVIKCKTMFQAEDFAQSFKRDYSRYLFLEHGLSKSYENIDSKPREINDMFYLRDCIAYVLMNPVVPKIVNGPEHYKWSSFDAYYGFGYSCLNNAISVKDLSAAKLRRLFKTKFDFSDSNILLDSDMKIINSSFVDYKLVEKIFNGITDFFRSLAIINSVKEEEKYVTRRIKYDDNELLAEAIDMTSKRFNVTELLRMTKEQKFHILVPLLKKTKASPKRIARVLRMNPGEVYKVIGIDKL